MQISIEKRVYVDNRGTQAYFQGKDAFANFFGEQGIFVLSKN
jgi:hypothetical protein